MSDDKPPKDLLNELFGNVIFSYSDGQAIEDGVLVPFVAGGRDTRHRVTRNAYEALKAHYAPQYPAYKDRDFYRFFFNELLPLAPFAIRQYERGDVLTTDFDFRVRKYEPEHGQQLWYIPNEVSGVTMMLPEDN